MYNILLFLKWLCSSGSQQVCCSIRNVFTSSVVIIETRQVEFTFTLRSRMEFHPQQNERWTLSIPSNELCSRLPLKPSFGPGGLPTCNVFFQKTVGLQ